MVEWNNRVNIDHKMCEYTIGKVIGKGVYGDIHEGNSPGGDVAIKSVSVKYCVDQAIIREMDFLLRTSHPNIISGRGAWFDQKDFKFNFVMDLATVDMEKWSSTKYDRKSYDIFRIFFELFSALAFLEEHDTVTGDLKPSNIMLQDGVIKLIDFGLMENLKNNNLECKNIYTIWYRAPEIFLKVKYNTNCDVWAAGCTLYEILTGRPPFTSLSSTGMIKEHRQFDRVKRVRTGLAREFTQNTLDQLYDIIDMCLVKNSTHRPFASQILSSKFSQYKPTKGYLADFPYPHIGNDDKWRKNRIRYIKYAKDFREFVGNPHIWIVATTLMDRLVCMGESGTADLIKLCFILAVNYMITPSCDVSSFFPKNKWESKNKELLEMCENIGFRFFYPNQFTRMCDMVGEEETFNYMCNLE